MYFLDILILDWLVWFVIRSNARSTMA